MDAAGQEALARRLKARAAEEGFAACGICAPDAIPEAAGRLRAFVAAGWHGQMRWMAERMRLARARRRRSGPRRAR